MYGMNPELSVNEFASRELKDDASRVYIKDYVYL